MPESNAPVNASSPSDSSRAIESIEVDGIPILERTTWRARPGSAPKPIDLFIEVPHGATTQHHFDAVRDRLRGDLAGDLDQFFFVNTDVGAPEAAEILARELTDGDMPLRSVQILRGLVPRTFADFNRVLDAHDALTGEGWNPAVPGYVRDSRDRELLAALHRGYDEVAHSIHDEIGRGDGFSVILHSYAPKSVGVKVDDDIVSSLRRAYEPKLYAEWPERPVIEAITETPDGRTLTDQTLVDALVEAYGTAGTRFALNETYRLHPGTSGTAHSERWPGRTLSIEINRASCVPEFIPFVELDVDRTRVEALVSPLAKVLRSELPTISTSRDENIPGTR